MTSRLIAMTLGMLITDHFSEVAFSQNVMTTTVFTSHSRVTVCIRLYFIVCVCPSKRAEFVCQKS